MSDTLLEVRDLQVAYQDPGEEPVLAVDGASFDLAPGEALGILGESGCGKSSLALAIPGLLPTNGAIFGGTLRFRGQALESLSERQLESLRGAEIGLIFQEPGLALHPLRRVGAQVLEVLRTHCPAKPDRLQTKMLDLLAEVGFTRSAEIAKAYPHQLSGGQRQRIVIAQALAGRPALIIADEPTAALDSITRRQVLSVLRNLKERSLVAFVLISHDPQILASIADRVLVMYAGQVVEEGPLGTVLAAPLHPYTKGLLRCVPPVLTAASGERLQALPVIPGSASSLWAVPEGCRFAPRCAYQKPQCLTQAPAMVELRARRWVRCVRDLG